MPYWTEHGSTDFFWAGIIIDVQGELGYLSTDKFTPACFTLTGYTRARWG
jgi:hypothetical protein